MVSDAVKQCWKFDRYAAVRTIVGCSLDQLTASACPFQHQSVTPVSGIKCHRISGIMRRSRRENIRRSNSAPDKGTPMQAPGLDHVRNAPGPSGHTSYSSEYSMDTFAFAMASERYVGWRLGHTRLCFDVERRRLAFTRLTSSGRWMCIEHGAD
jgi:hypothetical protein